MERPFGAADDEEWEEVGSFYGEQPASQAGSRPANKTIVDQGYVANWSKSANNIDRIVNQTALVSNQDGSYYFNNLRAGNHGGAAEPHYQLSEDFVYSDFNTTASIDPIAVQSAVQGTFSWVDDNKCESTADSGFFSAQSKSSIYHTSDPYSASSYSHLATETSPEDYSEQLQVEDSFNESSFVPPWHPGARDQLDQVQAFEPINYFLDPAHYNPTDVYDEANDYHQPSDIDESLQAPSIADSQPAPTVSSHHKSSVRSHTRHIQKGSHNGVTTCEQCGAEFTGRYRRGNCSRHVRQQHTRKSLQQTSDCVCRVCKKPFARQDARRKHEWRKHGLQDTRPHPRRQEETHEDDMSHAGTYYTNEGTLTHIQELLHEPAISIHYRVPAYPQRIHDHFLAVKADFGDDAYDNYCETFLADSRSLVTALEAKQSPIHHIFDRALRGLSMQLCPEQLKDEASPSVNDEDLVEADNDNHGTTARARQQHGKSPVTRRPSNASAAYHPYGGRPNKKTNGDPLIALLDLFEVPECLDLDCPVHKWHLFRADQGLSTCNGCIKEHMNGVRQHLLPSYSRQHLHVVSYLKRCTKCKEDIVSDAVWRSGGHEAKTCMSITQPRDIEVLVWARLYLKIYPQEFRVPSPYVNDMRYLPDELVSRIRAQLAAPMSSGLPRTQVVQHQDLPTQMTHRLGEEHHEDVPARGLSDVGTDAVASLDADAALDIMLAQAEHLVASLRAEKRLRASRAPVNVDGIEADFNTRRQAQRQPTLQTAPPYADYHMPMAPPQIQVQAPITGGADFQMPPNMQPDVMADVVQVPGSYIGTHPSTYSNFQDEASYRRLSLLNSSQTDYDAGPPSTYLDQSPSAVMSYYASMDPTACPPATYFPENQWMYDARLDAPGSSRLPETIAEEYYNSDQLAADVDQINKMEILPSQGLNAQQMSTSHTPTNHEKEAFGQRHDWYPQ